MRVARQVLLIFLFLPGMALPVSAQAVPECGSLQSGGLGPLDYRTAPEKQKRAVESVHFTPEVEALKGGKTTAHVGGDLSYTLGVFPNHPRALVAMARLSEVQKKAKPRGAAYSIDCYFERAIRFTPTDANVRLIFGTHLLIRGQTAAAIEQLRIAEKHAPESGNVAYNLGLGYFEMKDYAKAREYAKRARDRGISLPGLQNKLKGVGQWHD